MIRITFFARVSRGMNGHVQTIVVSRQMDALSIYRRTNKPNQKKRTKYDIWINGKNMWIK